MIFKEFIFLVVLIGLSSATHIAIKKDPEHYCFIMNSNITGTVEYVNNQNKTVSHKFEVKDEFNITGYCFGKDKDTNESIAFSFYPSNISFAPWTISLAFAEVKGQAFKLSNYTLEANFGPEFNDSVQQTQVKYTKPLDAELEWAAEGTHGFSCSSSTLKLTNNSQLVFSDLKVIAYAIYDSPDFKESQLFEQCKLDVRTSDLVPIVVGACLAGLVIIVLIAYLIGRARAKRQGYASV